MANKEANALHNIYIYIHTHTYVTYIIYNTKTHSISTFPPVDLGKRMTCRCVTSSAFRHDPLGCSTKSQPLLWRSNSFLCLQVHSGERTLAKLGRNLVFPPSCHPTKGWEGLLIHKRKCFHWHGIMNDNDGSWMWLDMWYFRVEPIIRSILLIQSSPKHFWSLTPRSRCNSCGTRPPGKEMSSQTVMKVEISRFLSI